MMLPSVINILETSITSILIPINLELQSHLIVLLPDLTCSNNMDLDRQLNFVNKNNLQKLQKYSDNILKIMLTKILGTWMESDKHKFLSDTINGSSTVIIKKESKKVNI